MNGRKRITCPDCQGFGFFTRTIEELSERSAIVRNEKCPRCDGFRTIDAPLTNADRIRSMNNYELAVFLAKVRALVYRADLPVIAYSTQDMAENLEWLQKPVEG